jgi:hypothetical protein
MAPVENHWSGSLVLGPLHHDEMVTHGRATEKTKGGQTWRRIGLLEAHLEVDDDGGDEMECGSVDWIHLTLDRIHW